MNESIRRSTSPAHNTDRPQSVRTRRVRPLPPYNPGATSDGRIHCSRRLLTQRLEANHVSGIRRSSGRLQYELQFDTVQGPSDQAIELGRRATRITRSTWELEVKGA